MVATRERQPRSGPDSDRLDRDRDQTDGTGLVRFHSGSLYVGPVP